MSQTVVIRGNGPQFRVKTAGSATPAHVTIMTRKGPKHVTVNGSVRIKRAA